MQPRGTSPNSQYTSYVYTQKKPRYQKLHEAIGGGGGRPLCLPLDPALTSTLGGPYSTFVSVFGHLIYSISSRVTIIGLIFFWIVSVHVILGLSLSSSPLMSTAMLV